MKDKKKWIIGGIIVVIIIGMAGFAIAGRNNGDSELVTVTRRDLQESVKVAGRVEAQTIADLGFEVSGTARSVFVDVDDVVTKGERLITLDLGTLAAELKSAQADVTIQQAEVDNTSINLTTIRQKQDTLVESAYKKLLSEGLIAEPTSETYTQTPPAITGRYAGPEGQYKLLIKRASQPEKYDLFVFGVESPGGVRINETGSTPIGTYGLFVNFSDTLSTYQDTNWTVTIPNTESSIYTANKNAYEEALRERERAIEEAQAQLRQEETGTSIAEAELARAEASVARIQAEIAKRTLFAPFAGMVTAVNVDPGEIVSANTTALSLISDDGFGVEIDLPEVDSVKVSRGNPASITLDAFGETTVFPATVISVNRSETIVDDIPVYEARLAFDENDPRIASGMTADVTIVTDARENVLALPVRVLRTRDDGTTYVVLFDTEREITEEIDVATGLRSTDGFVEIVAGVSEGDTVYIPK